MDSQMATSYRPLSIGQVGPQTRPLTFTRRPQLPLGRTVAYLRISYRKMMKRAPLEEAQSVHEMTGTPPKKKAVLRSTNKWGTARALLHIRPIRDIYLSQELSLRRELYHVTVV